MDEIKDTQEVQAPTAAPAEENQDAGVAAPQESTDTPASEEAAA